MKKILYTLTALIVALTALAETEKALVVTLTDGTATEYKISEIAKLSFTDVYKFTGYIYDSDYNLWKSANVSLTGWYFANNDWDNSIEQPDISVTNNRIFLHTPAEMGQAQWQGQFTITTDIEVSANEYYDFSCHINVPTAGSATVYTLMMDDSSTGFEGTMSPKKLVAGDNVIYFHDLQGFDGRLQIAFDFAGMADMDIEITDIVFKNSKYDDGTNPGPSAFWDADRNLWAQGNITLLTTWFSGVNWDGMVPSPDIVLANDYMFLHVPAGTGPYQWQGQVHVGSNIKVSAANNYDFRCYVTVPADGNVTIKVQKIGNDDTLFEGTDFQIPVKAGKNTISFIDKPGFDGSLQISYDFAGMADMDIEITHTHFQVHQ